jgi:RHS repeat-associated protein
VSSVEEIALSGGTRKYLVADALGSVRAVISSSGSVLGTASYDAYGTPSGTGVSSNSFFGFAGGYTDATGLVYLVYRYYDPQTGQFLSVDPLVDETGAAYSYAKSDPVEQDDPLGLGEVSQIACCIVLGIGGIATTATVNTSGTFQGASSNVVVGGPEDRETNVLGGIATGIPMDPDEVPDDSVSEGDITCPDEFNYNVANTSDFTERGNDISAATSVETYGIPITVTFTWGGAATSGMTAGTPELGGEGGGGNVKMVDEP